MTYDLRRLRLNGLIRRIEHTHTCVLIPDGQRLAIFYTKLCNRLLRPLAAADQPQAPPALRHAQTIIDHHVEDYITRARLKPGARKHDSYVQNPGPNALAWGQRWTRTSFTRHGAAAGISSGRIIPTPAVMPMPSSRVSSPSTRPLTRATAARVHRAAPGVAGPAGLAAVRRLRRGPRPPRVH